MNVGSVFSDSTRKVIGLMFTVDTTHNTQDRRVLMKYCNTKLIKISWIG